MRHQPVQDRHNARHPRDPVRFSGDQTPDFQFRIGVKPLFFLTSGNPHAFFETEN